MRKQQNVDSELITLDTTTGADDDSVKLHPCLMGVGLKDCSSRLFVARSLH